MRFLIRLTMLVATAATLLVPSAASATAPTATLTAATITFTTNDDDKDADTQVLVDLTAADGRPVATRHDQYSHFDDNSVHGPYGLYVFEGITAANLVPGSLRIEDQSSVWDTWKFGYRVTLTFSDGTTYVVSEKYKQLDDWDSFTTSFAVVAQARVPDLRGMSQTEATAALKAVGLVAGTVFTKKATRCEDVGTVLSSSPGAGSPLDAGRKVDITIGTKPSTPCV